MTSPWTKQCAGLEWAGFSPELWYSQHQICVKILYHQFLVFYNKVTDINWRIQKWLLVIIFSKVKELHTSYHGGPTGALEENYQNSKFKNDGKQKDCIKEKQNWKETGLS